jgi:putative NIF3 family GTP cyclohydrolase 1 type 2
VRVGEIYDILDQLSPFDLQEKWDNSGLLLGSREMCVDRIILSVDIDAKMIEEAEENTLFVLHHPLIFSGLKRLVLSEYPANLLQKMIQKNHAMIAMHTNFDQTHLNAYVATEVLGYEITHKDGFVAYMEVNEDFTTFAKNVGEKLGLEVVRTVKIMNR